MRAVFILWLGLIAAIGCLAVRVGKTQMTEEPDCKADLMATSQYVLILKEQRDRYEQEIARLRYYVNNLRAENTVLQQQKKEKKK